MQIKLNENIRRLRRESGLTQEQLAEALGVTTGAVHKWESGKATPELSMLVDLAAFFETSVDALLDYGWQKLSMGQTAEKLAGFAAEKQLEEGIRFAEKALQKYPNSFAVVFRSAELCFLKMDPYHAPRAVELYSRALTLMDQNDNEKISPLTIRNRIAMCYCYMDRYDRAVELLKKNNAEGINDFRIGLLLSREKTQAEEALKYLSEALVSCYSKLYNLCVGYANAYSALGRADRAAEFTRWLYELGKGLRDPGTVTWMDRGDVCLCMILAGMEAAQGKRDAARSWLREARSCALKFDAAPEYRTMTGMKFYHGSEQACSYDDMGTTAMSVIENHLAEEENGALLRDIWEQICAEA